MIGNIIAKFTIWALNSKSLSGEQKALCTTTLLKNLQAFPISSIISFDEQGTLLIRGKKLDIEQARQVSESANGMLNSVARKILKEQIQFKAIEMGVHQAVNADMVVFSKAALWCLEQEDKFLSVLSGEDSAGNFRP